MGDAMSDLKNNEKKSVTERANNNVQGNENHRNPKNNGYKKYHHKRPYQKHVEKSNEIATDEKAVVQNPVNAEGQNLTKKNSQPHVRNVPKKNGEQSSDSNREFKKNPRQNNFERRKSSHANVRVEETIQDIDIDIGRIEKEIELEIKEIAAFKFGL